jgi:hypothetical protein
MEPYQVEATNYLELPLLIPFPSIEKKMAIKGKCGHVFVKNPFKYNSIFLER